MQLKKLKVIRNMSDEKEYLNVPIDSNIKRELKIIGLKKDILLKDLVLIIFEDYIKKNEGC